MCFQFRKFRLCNKNPPASLRWLQHPSHQENFAPVLSVGRSINQVEIMCQSSWFTEKIFARLEEPAPTDGQGD